MAAKKSRAKPKEKAAAAKPKAKPKKASVAATTLTRQEEEDKEQRPTKRSDSKAPNLDEQVRKAICVNLRGWTHHDLHSHLVDGVSAYEKLLKDKQASNEGSLGIPMGSKYYAEFRVQFEAEDSPAKKLKCGDNTLPIDPVLEAAIHKMTGTRIDVEPLWQWMSKCELPNRRNVIACLKVCHNLNVFSNFRHAQCIVECMRWIKRWNMMNTYKEDIDICRPLFDAALERTWVHLKSEDCEISTATWFERYEEIVKLFLPSPAFKKCVMHNGEWTDIKDELSQVVKTRTGLAIFSKAWKSLTGTKIHSYIMERLELLKAEPQITSARLDKEEVEFSTIVKAYNKDPVQAFVQPKKIFVTYCGRTSQCIVKSFMEEWNAHKMALIKTIALDKNILEAIGCEKQLHAQDRPVSPVAIELGVLKEAITCRKACKEILDGHTDMDGAALLKVLTAKSKVLRGFDKTWMVEEGFWVSIQGAQGIDALQHEIRLALPSATVALTVPEAMGRLGAIEASALYNFCGASPQAIVQTIKQYLTLLASKRTPEWASGTTSSFMQSVKEQFQFFCRFEMQASSTAAGETLTGSSAASQMLAAALQKTVDGEALTLHDIQPLQTFEWLLTAPQQDQVHSFIDTLLGHADVGLVGSSACTFAKKKLRVRGKVAAAADAQHKLVRTWFD
jgi:hypothetical protein